MEEENVLGIFRQKSLFWQPDYLDISAWVEHVPFALWIVEVLKPKILVELGVHNGTSYFSFCQSVKNLDIETACYGVDTWQGDEHAGFYGDDIFGKVQSYNAIHYSRFSTLLRSTFDEAVSYFLDGSIDLLHIDGLHTYEAVKHDFDTWFPKLSPDAFVIFHDINVRERQFGVFRLWEELKSNYDFLQFDFGHGLGIISIGNSNKPGLEKLFHNNREENYFIFMRNLFADRGNSIKLRLEQSILVQQERSGQEQLNANFQQLTENYKTLEAHYFQLIETRKTQGEEIERLKAGTSNLELQLQELSGNYKTLEAHYFQLIEARKTLSEENDRLKAGQVAHEQQEKELSEQYKILETHYFQLIETRKTLSEENEGFREKARKLEQEMIQLQDRHTTLSLRNQELEDLGRKQEVDSNQAINKYEKDIRELDASIEALRSQLTDEKKRNAETEELIDSQLQTIQWYKNTYEDRNILGVLGEKIRQVIKKK